MNPLMMPSMRAAFVVTVLFFWTLPSCDPVDGTHPYALWDTFDHPEGIYHFHYLAPPWEKADVPFAVRQILYVGSARAPLSEMGIAGDGLQARFGCFVETTTDVDAIAAAEADAENLRHKGVQPDPIDWFESAGGDLGVQLKVRCPDRWIASVYHDLPEGGVIRMSVVGIEDTDTPDLVLLMESLEPRGAGEQ